LPLPLVCLVDKRGRVVWRSSDPLDENERAGSIISEDVVDDDRPTILDALSRCFFQEETVSYTVTGRPEISPEKRPSTWQVQLMPIHGWGELSGCCVCRMLPEYHAEIKDDERTMLTLLCEDKTLKEIAQAMYLSESAIDSKIRTLKDKMGVRNIGGLVSEAIIHSLV